MAGYRKTPTGTVELRGSIKNGAITDGTVLFNLPAGYRPANERAFAIPSGSSTMNQVRVSSAGDVTLWFAGGANRASLDSVRFDV